MKKKIACLLFPLLILLFSNCSPTLELQSVAVLPTVQGETVKEVAESYVLSGKKYRFPSEVTEVQYNPQWQQMTINYSLPRRKTAYAIYDVATEQLNWSNQGDYRLAMLQKDIVMASYQDKKILLNTENGLPIRWVNQEEFAVIDDSVTLKLGDQFSRVDLRTGTTKWTRRGESRFEGWMSDELDGDWMYIIADGLHGFNMLTGEGWYHQATTNYDATRGGKAVANGILIGLNILSIAAGGPVFDDFLYFDPLRAHNIHAKPKIDGNRLYFADRKSIVGLQKKSGRLLWETKVKEELGVSDLKLLSENRLLLLGKGYRYVDYALDKDKQAALYLLDTNDGDILEKKELPKGATIINHAINDAFIYVLTDRSIYRFDKQLNRVQRRKLPAIYGEPLRVVTWSSIGYDDFLTTDTPDFPLVIRTMQGILALHPVTLEELWFKRLGNLIQDKPQVLHADEWQLPILLQDADMRRSWVDETNEVFWFAKSRKIIGLDLLNEGATVGEFELPSDDFWYVGDGELVQFGGRDVRILRLKAE